MKAIRVREFGGPERLCLEEVDLPAPAAHELLVNVRAIGVNPVDTYIRSGTHSVRPALPYTPGGDAAGVVTAVGREVRRFGRGDHVYLAGSVSGTYAEQALALEKHAHLLPERVNFAQGAAVGVPYATAWRALFQVARARMGEVVLVHGASGGVGTAAVQLARAAGLTVIGTAGTDGGRALVAAQGAHHALDHAAPDFADQLSRLTQGRGVDLILEMLANRNLAFDLTLLARRGRVVVIGSRGTIEINPRDVMTCEATIHGMLLFNATDEELASVHAAIGAALENGIARPVIRQEMPLSEARRAHELVQQPGAHGKIVLIA